MLTCGYMMHAVIGSGQKGTANIIGCSDLPVSGSERSQWLEREDGNASESLWSIVAWPCDPASRVAHLCSLGVCAEQMAPPMHCLCIGSYSVASPAPKAVIFPFVFLGCGNPADLWENSLGAKSYLLHKHTQPPSSSLDSSASRKAHNMTWVTMNKGTV